MSLSNQLEEDLDWRFAELAELRKLVLSVKHIPLAYTSLLRALWVMLYAHYEGFCKFAISIFLEELENSGKEIKDFKDCIIIFSLEQDFKSLKNKSNAEFYEYLTKTFNDVSKNQIKFKRNRSGFEIKGESNLYPDSLIEMCSCIFIPKETIEENSLKLNTLVSRRNEIAHGKSHPIRSFDDYKLYEDAAFNVMVNLAIDIMLSLEEKKYLK